MNPVIRYNSREIEFPHDCSDIIVRYDHLRVVSRALSAVDTVTRALTVSVECEWQELSPRRDRDLLDDLAAWWMWASSGRAWTFSRDGDESVSGLLTAGMAAGAASAAVTTGLAIVPGKRYLVRDDLNAHVSVVESYDSSTGAVVFARTSDYAFGEGATIRSLDHWAGKLTADTPDFPAVTNPPAFYSITLRFQEAR